MIWRQLKRYRKTDEEKENRKKLEYKKIHSLLAQIRIVMLSHYSNTQQFKKPTLSLMHVGGTWDQARIKHDKQTKNHLFKNNLSMFRLTASVSILVKQAP